HAGPYDVNSVRSVVAVPPLLHDQVSARFDGWNHRFRRKAERFVKESTNPERQRRKRDAYSDQAVPTAVPRALDRPVVPGEAIRMDRADYRDEQQSSVAGQSAAKHEQIAQRDDRYQRKIYGGPAGPSDIQHAHGLDEQPEHGRSPLLRLAVD